jgi:hypothetical protein
MTTSKDYPVSPGCTRRPGNVRTVRRLACLSALALLALVAAAEPSAAGPPAVQPANRSTHIPGAENGLVPDGHLVTVGPGCRAASCPGRAPSAPS